MDSVRGDPSEERTDGPLSTVLITIDSLRSDTIAADGRPKHAPTLAALAERGTVFENAFAHGNWTPFSFPSVFASRPVFAELGDIGLPGSPTLAETLSAAGIDTAGINAANGFLTDFWGYGRGFDDFLSYVPDAGSGAYSKYVSAHPTVQGWIQLASVAARGTIDRVCGTDGNGERRVEAGAADVEARARAFIEAREADDPPFFLWLHYMDAHTPYIPAPRHVKHVTGDRIGLLRTLRAHAHTGLGLEVDAATRRRLRGLYRAAVHAVDTSVRGVLDALSDRGLRDRTCVIVAGDHGEEFEEHGHLAHYPKLYEELIHVPLIVDHPHGEGGRIPEAVGLKAIPPTVCETIGVAPPEAFEGESLLDTVRGEASPDAEPVLSVAVRGETVTQQPIPRRLDEGELLVSARTREWTYIRHVDSGTHELYDRASDPAEQRNVIEAFADSEIVSRLAEATTEHAARLGGEPRAAPRTGSSAGSNPGSNSTSEPPSGVAARLEALGYR